MVLACADALSLDPLQPNVLFELTLGRVGRIAQGYVHIFSVLTFTTTSTRPGTA